ncbi:MAG: hypothetical protein RJA44_1780 [Pseudomonadota bacterium]|jgi:metal-sulfur cluster biosynthetic enzyme
MPALPLLIGPRERIERVLQCLRGVVDPAIGENIVDLGLIESLQVGGGEAELMLLGTNDACPVSDLIADAAFRALQRALPDHDLYVRHDALRDWEPAHACPATRRRLAWLCGCEH